MLLYVRGTRSYPVPAGSDLQMPMSQYTGMTVHALRNGHRRLSRIFFIPFRCHYTISEAVPKSCPKRKIRPHIQSGGYPHNSPALPFRRFFFKYMIFYPLVHIRTGCLISFSGQYDFSRSASISRHKNFTAGKRRTLTAQ